MKKLYITAASAAIIAAFASPALAGNITVPFDDPHVAAPVQSFSWSGVYAGASAGMTRAKETHYTKAQTRPMTKLDLGEAIHANKGCEGFEKVYTVQRGEYSFPVKCSYMAYHTPNSGWVDYTVVGADPVVTKKARAVSVSKDYETYGAFAGYRHQFGSGVVLGGEVAGYYLDDSTTFEATAQAGYALGRFLPYLKAGYDFSIESAVYGVGMDYAITDRIVIGSEYTHIDAIGADRVTARVAIKF